MLLWLSVVCKCPLFKILRSIILLESLTWCVYMAADVVCRWVEYSFTMSWNVAALRTTWLHCWQKSTLSSYMLASCCRCLALSLMAGYIEPMLLQISQVLSLVDLVAWRGLSMEWHSGMTESVQSICFCLLLLYLSCGLLTASCTGGWSAVTFYDVIDSQSQLQQLLLMSRHKLPHPSIAMELPLMVPYQVMILMIAYSRNTIRRPALPMVQWLEFLCHQACVVVAWPPLTALCRSYSVVTLSLLLTAFDVLSADSLIPSVMLPIQLPFNLLLTIYNFQGCDFDSVIEVMLQRVSNSLSVPNFYLVCRERPECSNMFWV